MGRFFINGIVIKPIESKEFKPGMICKTVWVEEKRNSKKPTTYTYKIEFNGGYSAEIPDKVKLLGANVAIMGFLNSYSANEANTPFINLKGEKFMLLALSSFEEQPEDEDNSTDIDGDDLPF